MGGLLAALSLLKGVIRLIYRECSLSQDHKQLYIVPISDLHIGDKNVDYDKFYETRQWIIDNPNAYVILNGDILNTAIKSSVSDLYHEEMNPNEQLKLAVKLFEPIKDRILMIVEGNHERRIAKETSICISEILASHLGLNNRFSPDGALLKIKFGKRENGKPQVYTLYCTHGFGGGKKPGGKVNNLQSLSSIVIADIYLMSHVHILTTFSDYIFMPDLRNNKLNRIKRTYVTTGAYLDYGGYAETYGFNPTGTGSPTIVLSGGEKKKVVVKI